MKYTPQELLAKAKEYAQLRNWRITYFRLWKLVEFIYWLETGKLMTEQTRTNRKRSQQEIESIIKELEDNGSK